MIDYKVFAIQTLFNEQSERVEDYKGMQIFKTASTFGESLYGYEKEYKAQFDMHITEIGRFMVHGEFYEFNDPNKPPESYMSGFIELEGREPTVSDNVAVYYRGNNQVTPRLFMDCRIAAIFYQLSFLTEIKLKLCEPMRSI